MSPVMKNPHTEEIATVSHAGADVLKRRGWTPVEAEKPKKPAAGDGDEPVDHLENLSRDELNQLASEKGIDSPDDLPNKAAVIKAIRKAG